MNINLANVELSPFLEILPQGPWRQSWGFGFAADEDTNAAAEP